MRRPALTAEDRLLYHLCLVKDARCIVVIASSQSGPIAAPVAKIRIAIVIAGAVMAMAIPVRVVVTGVTGTIAAGKIL